MILSLNLSTATKIGRLGNKVRREAWLNSFLIFGKLGRWFPPIQTNEKDRYEQD
jgi:hypothetical protein